MKTNKSYNTLFSFTTFIVLLFSISIQLSFAGTDTTKAGDQQFPLNDPRNPNCPCHKLQKQAEEEFAQQNNAKGQFNDVGNNNENKVNEIEKSNANLFSKIGVNSIRIPFSKRITKHKKKLVWINKVKFRFGYGLRRTKKSIPDYEICFKW